VERYFSSDGTDKFLGTQAILLSRALNVVAESVQELEFKMDSVWLSAAERQTLTLNLGDTRLKVAELLSWIERFASEEAPHLIRDAGKDGVIAIGGTLKQLRELVEAAQQGGATDNEGFTHPRVRSGLAELEGHLAEAHRLAGQIQRSQAFGITVEQDPSTSGRDNVILTIRSLGDHFHKKVRVVVDKSNGNWQSIGSVISPQDAPDNIYEIRVEFNLETVSDRQGEWVVEVKSGDNRTYQRPFYLS
jgi:hypothetical protein